MRGMSLIIPPVCDVTVPLLGAYQLAGFADRVGFPFAVHDCNIIFCELVVTYSLSQAKSNLSQCNLESKTLACFLNMFPEISTFKEFIEALRKCSDKHRYWKLMDFLRACYDLFSLQFTDLRFRIDGLDSEYKWNIWSDIETFVELHSNGILHKWLTKTLCGIDLSAHDAVGISITFESQLFTSLLLCSTIRKKSPKTQIILGGGFVNSLIDSEEAMGPLAQYCDCIFAGEGEALIDFLLNHELDELCTANIKYAKFVLPISICARQLSVSPPAFTKNNLEKYISPMRIIPLRFSYDCYWGKCTFCTDKEEHLCLEKAYDIDRMINYCTTAYAEGLFDGVYFLDSAITPQHAEKLARALIEKEMTFLWGTNFRFENAFNNDNLVLLMKQSGLVFAKFGLESGSQRVLDMMDKGTNVAIAASITHKFREHGILVHTYVMAAYPEETEEDRDKTAKFLLSEDSRPDNYNCSEFILYGSAKIAQQYRDKLHATRSQDGWHSASYSFTNDEVKKFIKNTREQFTRKFSPQSILLSTGHTIGFSNLFETTKHTYTAHSCIILSKKVVHEPVAGVSRLAWWKRNRGYTAIEGAWAEWLYLNLLVGVHRECLAKLGDSIWVIDALIEEGCLEYCDIAGNPAVCEAPDEALFTITHHSQFENLKWYGYHDAG